MPTVFHTLSVGGLRRVTTSSKDSPMPRTVPLKPICEPTALALRVVQFDRHPPTAHHPRRLAHVREKRE